jgi:hypothetical protein
MCGERGVIAYENDFLGIDVTLGRLFSRAENKFIKQAKLQ